MASKYKNATIVVRTEDELKEACKKGFGKIYPEGTLKEELINKIEKKQSGVGYFAKIGIAGVGTFLGGPIGLTIAGTSLGSAFSDIKFLKYKIYSEPDGRIYFTY